MSTGSIRRHRAHAVGGETYTGAGVTTSDDLDPAAAAGEASEADNGQGEAGAGQEPERTGNAPETVAEGEERQPDTSGGVERNDDGSAEGDPHADAASGADDPNTVTVSGVGETQVAAVVTGPGGEPIENTPEGEPASQEEPEAPAGNASRDDWEAYALTQGYSEDDLDGLGRDAIRDLFA